MTKYTDLLVLGILVVAVTSSPVPAMDFTSSNLPIMVIHTDGKDIPNEPKISAWMGIIDNGPEERNHVGDSFNGYEGPIGIEIRGSSAQGFPKKSYAVETRDVEGKNRNVSLLGMPPENDWVLYGPYSDKSLMRNVLAYWMANQMGYYASRTRFCEVVLNGEHVGAYVLMEKIKRDKNRIDIAELKTDDVTGDDLTGGYMIRMDRYIEGEVGGWYSAYAFGKSRLFYQYYYPESTDIVPEQEAYLRGFFDELEDTIVGDRFSDPEEGYAKYIDVASFVDYLIVNEVAKNVDAYRLSMFMYKDKDSVDGKLFMGPVWDFDFAFGNVDYNVSLSVPVQGLFDQGLQINNPFVWFSVPFWFWWRRILQDESFIQAIGSRWQELRKDVLRMENLAGKIDEMAIYLEEAQTRNFERWPILGEHVWPNNFVGQTYMGEVEYLKQWLDERLTWMDSNLLNDIRLVTDISPERLIAIEESTAALPWNFTLEQNFPNPFNRSTVIRFALPEKEEIELAVFNLAGQKVVTLVEGLRNVGTYTVRWDSRDEEGSELASGIYVYRLQAGIHTETRRLVLLR